MLSVGGKGGELRRYIDALANLIPLVEGFFVHASDVHAPFARGPREMTPMKPPPPATSAVFRSLAEFPPRTCAISILRRLHPACGSFSGH